MSIMEREKDSKEKEAFAATYDETYVVTDNPL
jgi:hypothetical protein